MSAENRKIIIQAISSGIGGALGHYWLERGEQIFGTYRGPFPEKKSLQKRGAFLDFCDLSERTSLLKSTRILREKAPGWDVLVLGAGVLSPIGSFEKTCFTEWSRSYEVNFLRQLEFTHQLLPARNQESDKKPLVLFFAGGGTNSATPNYSAYNLAKVSLIKMCEFLDAEMPDTRFCIVGPGWVNTKIHRQTIEAGEKAGASYQATLHRIEKKDFVSLDQVVKCCEWISHGEKTVVGGRNFAVASDRWGSQELSEALKSEPDFYKLRRYGNDISFSQNAEVRHAIHHK